MRAFHNLNKREGFLLRYMFSVEFSQPNAQGIARVYADKSH